MAKTKYWDKEVSRGLGKNLKRKSRNFGKNFEKKSSLLLGF